MIIVTGGSGKAGRACISELLAHHYEVASVDLVRPPDVPVPFTRVELTDFGQTIAAFSQIDDRIFESQIIRDRNRILNFISCTSRHLRAERRHKLAINGAPKRRGISSNEICSSEISPNRDMILRQIFVCVALY